MCSHDYERIDNYLICTLCGIEQDNFQIIEENYYQKNIQEDYNNYFADLDNDLKNQILNTFESVLEQHTVRGVGRKALLAACFFYKLLESKQYSPTSRDVYKRFNLEKKKFGEGKKLFLLYNCKYRTMNKKISEYINSLVKTFDISDETLMCLQEKCERFDNDGCFINFNPYSVCACILYTCMNDREKKRIKKNLFTTTVGMSDKTVEKILNLIVL
jgi:transcription initiation factor TFIIIB Brf1 subunit/transcription initiation factor TFIIB